MSTQSDELEKFHPSHCNKYEILRGVYPNDRRLTNNPCSCGFEKVTLAWREQYAAEQVKNTNETGHWWTHGKRLDAYGNTAHYCKCGYAASNSDDIKGHVEWKIKQLTAELSKDTK